MTPIVPPDVIFDVQNIHAALEYAVPDENALVNIIGRREYAQLVAIARHYKATYAEDLPTKLDKRILGSLGSLLASACQHKVLAQSQYLHRAGKSSRKYEAMRKKDTALEVFCEASEQVLIGKTTEELKEVQEAFTAVYEANLIDHVLSFCEDDNTKVFFTNIFQEKVDTPLENVEASVEKLHQVLGAQDMASLLSYVSSLTTSQLGSVVRTYNSTYQDAHVVTTIEKTIAHKHKGDQVNLLLFAVMQAADPARHVAMLLEESMEGVGTNEDQLSRLVILNRGKFMDKVKEAYHLDYSRTLADRVRGDTSGDYSHLVCHLINQTIYINIDNASKTYTSTVRPQTPQHGTLNNSSSSIHRGVSATNYPSSLHSVHAVQSSSSAVEISISQPPQQQSQHSLSIDTSAPYKAGALPSPEQSPDFYESSDPMSLGSKRMSEEQIEAIKSSKQVKEFYREQNELISDLLDPPEKRQGAAEREERNQVKLKIAIYGSVGVNIMLFVLQLYAAISSKSLSLFATMADSFMDLLSGVILMYAARASTKSNWFKYPSGKSRMETAGTIVFASLMATVSLQLIIESLRALVGGDDKPPMPSALAIAFVGIALASKLCLYIYCKALSQYNSADILAKDHRNDLFVNGFGLFASLLSRFCWWLDPVGAIVVALIILRSWVWTAYEQVQLIVGKTADPAFLKKLTYIALTHHRKILQVDTCMAYHAGNNLFVEVDVVMAPDTPLIESHDISEGLQMKLEALPNVERAFVHVDYETSHAPEHRKSK
ncbi:hypothetical protein BGZ98_008311 [Dissophora globulifera]|nr:hypothetical protein BGZ98_008311 [Dissophora globulifera]